ncbi:hypothetical protein [Bradyrhizobium lablabi]|uniref:hypothetical protein n=1 Tax=Bradyrhizobium lablabi TaxID=722472 RepID=UPI001BAA6553|nr:hypothetical protein [Bradyrhizobium lablabi]MBR0693492.1 hypothetical protein [Bradyrhizobium lablabi]
MGLLDNLGGEQPGQVPEIRPDTPHYEAVGRFVTSFANAEAAVHLLVRQLSGMPDDKARIVFGGMRLPDLTEIIRRLMRIDNAPLSNQTVIDDCLTQLVAISKRRHSLVHRGASFFDGKLVVSNVLISKHLHSSELEVFEIEELRAMQLDCGTICLKLDRIINPDQANPFSLTDSFVLGRPWRYKHAPPRTPNLRSRAKSPKPKRRPPASHEKPKDAE